METPCGEEALGGERVERRLAAILAADVAGYSRLMGQDEAGTLNRLRAHRHELIDPKVAEHKGRIVKTTGDGLLVEFPSVVEAVACAVSVQRGMAQRNAETPEGQRIIFRVGVNLGDVIVDDGDIFGDGVNVTARLEALAEPGGICISGTVRDHVGDRLPYAFTAMGEQNVKNIASPVRAYGMSATAVAATPIVAAPAQPGSARRSIIPRGALIAAILVAAVGIAIAAWLGWPHTGSRPVAVRTPGSPQSLPAPGTAAKPAPRLSIVVLPLVNLSSDPEQEYLADSITDDLTTDLSQLQDSFVIARSTASTYKGKPVDVKQIGHDLGVRYVLEGSVRRLGEQVQINAQLIDAETGAHVWADRFDTDRQDLAKAQSEITSRLARTLDVELVEAAGRQVAQEKTPDARDLVVRGWAALYRPNTRANRQEALQAFEEALKLDPGSVDARVGIATVLIFNIQSGWSKSPKEDHVRAEPLLTEALESNDNNSRAHLAMGLLRRDQNRLNESQVELEKAIALDPNYATAYNHLGWTLIALGKPAAALPHFEKAIRIDPQSEGLYAFYAGEGYCYLLLGKVDQAVDFLERARVANPRIWYIQMLLAAALGLRGDIDEAKEALVQSLKIKPGLNSLAKVHAVFRNPRLRALAAKTSDIGLRRAGLPGE